MNEHDDPGAGRGRGEGRALRRAGESTPGAPGPPGMAPGAAAAGNPSARVTVPVFYVTDSTFLSHLDRLESTATSGVAIEEVVVIMDRWSDDDDLRPNITRYFRRFVDLLDRDDIVIYGIRFSLVDWRGIPVEDMERLFGRVLPSHPTIQGIRFVHRTMPNSFMGLFTESVSAAQPTPLRSLEFDAEPLEHEDVQAIAAMVDRNVPLARLTLSPTLATEDAACLCRAVVRNKNIQHLTLAVDSMSADTLGLLASSSSSSSSSLQHLDVTGDFPLVDGISMLAKQLRTNTTMARLSLTMGTVILTGTRPDNDELFRPLLEALETYNFTLVEVSVGFYGGVYAGVHESTRVNEILRRNKRLQRALSLVEPRNYRVEPATLVPQVLGTVSGLPTLLYRFLRRGDAYQLLVRHPLSTRAAGAHAG